MSRRDLVHVLSVLWDRTGGDPAAGVSVDEVDVAIGRGRGDMRTPLNLRALATDGLVAERPDGTWTLTPEGVAWIREDQELSDR